MKRRQNRQDEEEEDEKTMRVAKHLKVACSKQDRSAHGSGPPGLIWTNHPPDIECTKATFPLSEAIIRDDTIYCSEICAVLESLWNTQLKKLEQAETALENSPNGWLVNYETHECLRCEWTHSVRYWNVAMGYGQRGDRQWSGVCATCALTLLENEQKQGRWVLSQSRVSGDFAGPKEQQQPQQPRLPDGWQQFVFDSTVYFSKDCSYNGLNCFGLTWGPLWRNCVAFTKTLVHGVVEDKDVNSVTLLWCASCMQDDDCVTRQAWWKEVQSAATESLVVNGTLITPIMNIVAQYLVSSYG